MTAQEILTARGYTEIVEKTYTTTGKADERWIIGFNSTNPGLTRWEQKLGGMAICIGGQRAGAVHPARSKARDGRVSECVADDYLLFNIEELESDPLAN